MVGQAEVVVGAEVQHLAAVGDLHVGRLGRADQVLGLVQAGRADVVEAPAQVVA
jgi:hypothetical protein